MISLIPELALMVPENTKQAAKDRKQLAQLFSIEYIADT